MLQRPERQWKVRTSFWPPSASGLLANCSDGEIISLLKQSPLFLWMGWSNLSGNHGLLLNNVCLPSVLNFRPEHLTGMLKLTTL